MQNINNIKKIIEKRKYLTSKTNIAKSLGISLPQLSNILAGRRKASPKIAERLKRYYTIELSNN